MAADQSDPISTVAALDEPSRRRLYDYVVGAREPVGRDEASESLGISRPTAAFHLDRRVDQVRRALDDVLLGVDEDANVMWAVELRADGLDLAPILSASPLPADAPQRNLRQQDHELDKHFDRQLISVASGVLENLEPLVLDLPVRNTDRAVGTMLGHEVTLKHGEDGLPPGSIDITLHGTAGQSLGAFLPRGIILRLEGDANDYVGKGLSGGDIVVRPHRDSVYQAERNVIAGNVIGYGATGGTLHISGIVGERFLVRNSGAVAVVEGVGDHALEYMTGGTAVILGATGRNLGAGMSGGVAYIYRLNPDRVNGAALRSGELTLDSLDRADIELLRSLLERHVECTGSTLAERMLADFDTTASDFVKVLPRDYAAVLATRATALEEGLDPDGDVVWTRIMEVTGG